MYLSSLFSPPPVQAESSMDKHSPAVAEKIEPSIVHPASKNFFQFVTKLIQSFTFFSFFFSPCHRLISGETLNSTHLQTSSKRAQAKKKNSHNFHSNGMTLPYERNANYVPERRWEHFCKRRWV